MTPNALSLLICFAEQRSVDGRNPIVAQTLGGKRQFVSGGLLASVTPCASQILPL